jgi:hypothetical protein
VPSIEGVALKINRSLEHLDALNKSGEAVFKDDMYGVYAIQGEANSQRTKYLFRAKMLKPLPVVEWGIIVGDAVHCLRSALDQLAYTLSVDPDGNTAFPMCRTKKDWVTQAPAMTWGIPEPFVALIDAVQPYHRGDAAAHTHPLAILNSLSNADKHRYVPVTALTPDRVEWKITRTSGIASHGDIRVKTGRALEEGAVLAEMSIVPDDSGLEPQVEMEGYIAFAIAFGQSGVPSAIAGKPVIKSFADLGGMVKSVLESVGKVAEDWIAAHGLDTPGE